MAQYVVTEINIEGKNVKQFSSFTLTQAIAEHHTFRLVCPTEAIDGTTGTVFNSSKNLIGASITIQVKAVNSPGTLKFAGVVTQIEAARFSGHSGDIIISGFSPTILTDNAPNCQSWENKAVKAIAQDVLQCFPQNLLQTKLNPVYGGTLAYTVQYKETAWQFLNRISCVFGEWCYYNGEKLILGLPQGNNAELIFGSNLSEFNMAMQLQPAKFQMMAYDYISHAVFDGTPAGIASKAGLNDLGKHALQKSEEFYNTQPKQWHNHFLTNKKQLDDFINTRAAMQSSNMIRFNGSSDHPGVQIGGSVNVQGKNVFNQEEETFGEFTVTSVNHQCDGLGNYSNEFVAIPASVKMPPPTSYLEPHCEAQSAMVTDNHDPNGLGRVRVKLHWMGGSEKTPWVRVTTPHAGSGKGGFFIPEIGEEVIVGFEGDLAEKPYIIGAVYNGKAKTDFANAENDLKVIQTRSGHIIKFDDKKGAESITIKDKDENLFKIDTAGGSITIKDKKSNKIVIDTTGNTIIIQDKNSNKIVMDSAEDSINITAKGSISMSASSINMLAKGAITMNAGAAIEGAAGTMVTFGAGVSTSLISGRDTIILAGKMLSASGGKNAKFSSGAGANIELQAKGEAKFSSSKKMDITSKQSTMAGTDKATFKSKETFVEGSSKAVVKGRKVDIS